MPPTLRNWNGRILDSFENAVEQLYNSHATQLGAIVDRAGRALCGGGSIIYLGQGSCVQQ